MNTMDERWSERLTIDFSGCMQDGLIHHFWTPYERCAMFECEESSGYYQLYYQQQVHPERVKAYMHHFGPLVLT
jgi:hypothetical protein